VKAVIGYLKEVKGELDRVDWPKKDEVVRLTAVVFLISAIVGAYLGGLDIAFTKLVELIIAK